MLAKVALLMSVSSKLNDLQVTDTVLLSKIQHTECESSAH